MKWVLIFFIGFIFSNGFCFYNIDLLVNWVKYDKDIYFKVCVWEIKKIISRCFIYVFGYGLLF